MREKSIIGRFRIRYSLYTEYILRYFSGETEKISYVKLSDRIIDFIENSRPNEYKVANKPVVDLLNQLFISRSTFISDDNDNDEKFRSKVYSDLIANIVSQSRGYLKDSYNSVESDVVLIFEALCKKYPNEPHFFAHLARYYFYEAKAFELGFKAIDDAIRISDEKNENGVPEASLYHMKAMGFKIYVTDKLIEELNSISKNYRNLDDIGLRTELDEKIKDILKHADLAFKYYSDSHNIDPNNIYSAYAEARFRIDLQHRLYNRMDIFATERKWTSTLIDKELSLGNIEALASNISECEHILELSDGSPDYDAMQRDVDRLKKDVELLNAGNEETIALCKQYLGSTEVMDKSPYRRILARVYMKNLNSNYDGIEQQQELRSVVSLMEDNIALNPENGANVRIWFDAVRHLDVADPSEVLISALQKLSHWIEGGKAPAEAYFYQYIVKFIYDYESGAIESAVSRRDLSNCLTDLKEATRRSKIGKRTITLEWLGKDGKGLRRLISSKEFSYISEQDRIKSLETLQGRLPSRKDFERNQRNAYLMYRGNEVFFSPIQISRRVSAINENQYVDFGLGFSYDGLRSYHDSINISKAVKKEEVSSGAIYNIDDVCTMIVTGHNSSFVIGEIINSGGAQVQVHKSKMEYANCKESEWPEVNSHLLVRLEQQRSYNGESIWNASTTSPYITRRI